MEILPRKVPCQEFRDMDFADEPGEFYYELINGIPEKKLSPTLRHQRISSEIELQLMAFDKKNDVGEMLHAPLDVVLDDNNVYHPHDRGDKKDIYEKHGVREYWLVDPRTSTLEVYTLVEERYKLTSYLEETDTLKSSVLEGFEMKLEGLFG